MGHSITFRQGAKLFRRLPEEMRQWMFAATDQTASEIWSQARVLSGGALTPRQLRQMDHPYAKAHRRSRRPRIAVLDAAVINRQSGAFLSAWRYSSEGTLFGAKARVVNADRSADFLDQGTTRMISRPIRQRLEVFGVVPFEENLKRELRRGFGGL